ncbi:MAG: NAD(P)-dependent oxidoreductase [Crocinitomicaceae bacterium]
MEKVNVIITGGSGFIGKDLLKKIDLSVFSVSLITRDKQKLIHLEKEGFKVVEADLSDVASLKKALAGQSILLNLAAEVRNIELLEKTNVQGTINLVEAIVSCGIQKVIHLSSVGVVGRGYSLASVVVTEKTLATPENEYERTKKISEEILIEAEKQGIFQLTILRPTNVFGENHPFNALLNLSQHLSSGKIVPYMKNAVVNYVYVSDVSATILFFLSDDRKGIYQVGSSMELYGFLSLMQRTLRKKAKLFKVPKLLIILANKLGLKQFSSVSNGVIYSDEKLRKIFNYPVGIEQGVINTLNDFENKKRL